MDNPIGYTTPAEVERLREGKTAVVQGEPSDACTVAVRLGGHAGAGPREFQPDEGLGKAEDWAVDTHSTSTPILTYQTCSVIEGEQAYGVLALVKEKLAVNAGAGPVDETYYDKGKDAAHFEHLNNKDFAWALTCAAQDLNDSDENVSEWMPVTALLGGAAERIQALEKALEPFAHAARVFEIAIGPDGIDDGLTVEARISARPEHEAVLSTEDFSRARSCLSTHTAAGAGPVGEAVADEGWQPIETAPTGGKFGCFLMLAFGPQGDQTVSEGMHFQGRFYAASVFYTGGPHDTKQFTFREHEVKPTHWRHKLAAPGAARPVGEPGEVERLVEETGSSSVDDLRDMALVGHSLMDVIGIATADGPYKDWTPAENPTEIVIDLINDLEEARKELAMTVGRHKVERTASAELNRQFDKRRETAEASLAESEQNAQGLASDLAGTQTELTETRERLEKVSDGNRTLPYGRDELGRFVREAWVRWAQTQPNPKPSWLLAYDELPEPDKEADRQIGETIARWTLIGDAARAALTGDAQEAGR